MLVAVISSSECFCQSFWEQTNYSGSYATAICFSTIGDLYAGNTYPYLGTKHYSLCRSTNNGSTWSNIDMAIPDRGDGGNGWYDIYSLIGCDSNIVIAGAWGVYGNWLYVGQWEALLYSSDSGRTWRQTFTGDVSFISNIVSSSPSFVVAAAGALLLSTDRGRSWRDIGHGLLPDIRSVAIDKRGYLYAASQNAYLTYTLFRSTNKGSSWDTIKTLPGVISEQVAVNAKHYLFVSTTTPTGIGQQPTYVLYRSTDDGASWQGVLTSNAQTRKIFIDSKDYVYLASNGVLRSSDDGTTWLPLTPSIAADAFTVNREGYLYAGGSGIYRSIQIVNDVKRESPRLSSTCSLWQNYPNPFNPITTISYQLLSRSQVSLRLYDVLGREVSTLVNETQEPGAHQVSWDASGFASGVYFYRLQAGSFVETKKLILLR
jgi:photosystem II stability/assembly factor-like uncharacterized protein